MPSPRSRYSAALAAHRRSAAPPGSRDAAAKRPLARSAPGPTPVEHWAKALASRPRSPEPSSLAGDRAPRRTPSIALTAGLIAMPLLIAAGILVDWTGTR